MHIAICNLDTPQLLLIGIFPENLIMPFFGPDFIIIGAMRAGTTTLANHLSKHPDIGMSRLKETDYYIAEKNYSRGPDWYSSLFPVDKIVTGEASPNYTKNDVFHGVPERIYKSRTDVKLIYIVRDPVERFFSQYKHSLLMGAQLPAVDEILSKHEGQHILASSMYYKQIQSYLDYFPREQIQVVDFKDLISDTYNIVCSICRHVGVSDELVKVIETRKDNSSDDLSNVSPWILNLSQRDMFIDLRAALPSKWKNNIRQAISGISKTNRQKLIISNSAIEYVSDALAEDTEKFRTLMKNDYSSWSV